PNTNPSTLNPQPSTPNLKPETLTPKTQTPNAKRQTPNPKPQTPNPKPQPPTPKPLTPTLKPCRLAAGRHLEDSGGAGTGGGRALPTRCQRRAGAFGVWGLVFRVSGFRVSGLGVLYLYVVVSGPVTRV
ncbi:hypothetical protein T484DRAFT_1617967, partial [Baffinella frigidus]